MILLSHNINCVYYSFIIYTMEKKNIFVISDTHFNHWFMIESWLRGKEYQSKIINKWKEVVWVNDTIIHLWDVIFDRPSELTEILKDLPGYKIHVRGNHDKNTCKWYMEHWFNESHDEYYLYHSKWIVHCTHKPTLTNAQFNLCWHLHWYTNNKSFRKKEKLLLTTKSRVISLEEQWYAPQNINDVLSDKHHSAIFIKEKYKVQFYLTDLYEYVKAKTKNFMYMNFILLTSTILWNNTLHDLYNSIKKK